MYCIQCGQRLPDTAHFCGACGTATQSPGVRESLAPRPDPTVPSLSSSAAFPQPIDPSKQGVASIPTSTETIPTSAVPSAATPTTPAPKSSPPTARVDKPTGEGVSGQRVMAVTVMIVGFLFSPLLARLLTVPPITVPPIAVTLMAACLGALLYPRRRNRVPEAAARPFPSAPPAASLHAMEGTADTSFEKPRTGPAEPQRAGPTVARRWYSVSRPLAVAGQLAAALLVLFAATVTISAVLKKREHAHIEAAVAPTATPASSLPPCPEDDPLGLTIETSCDPLPTRATVSATGPSSNPTSTTAPIPSAAERPIASVPPVPASRRFVEFRSNYAHLRGTIKAGDAARFRA